MRYDIKIKYLYGKALESGKDVELYKEIYKEHLRVWNNFNERGNPLKNTFEGFNNVFIKILKDVKEDNFDWKKSPITVNRDGYVLNGAHRMAACLVYDKRPEYILEDRREVNWNREFFIRLGLDKKYIDIVDEVYTG